MLQDFSYVYILANKKNGTLYVGATSNLKKRIWEHKSNLVEGFTKRYQIHKLVYYEACPNKEGALLREKQIKSGSRAKKVILIESMNPEWKDLYEDIPI